MLKHKLVSLVIVISLIISIVPLFSETATALTGGSTILHPISDVTTEWRTTGRDHWGEIDDPEGSPDTVTFISSQTDAELDELNMDNLLVGDNPPDNETVIIKNVTLFIYGRQGNVYIKPDWGADYGSVQSLGNGWGWRERTFTTTEGGDPISVANVNDMLFTITKYGSSGTFAEISCIYAEVYWTYASNMNFSGEVPTNQSTGVAVPTGGVETSVNVSYATLRDVIMWENYTADEVGMSIYDDTILGQSFEIGYEGLSGNFYLSSISVNLSRYGNPTGNMSVDLFLADVDEHPTGSALISSTINITELPTDYTVINVTDDYMLMSENDNYVIVLNQTDGVGDASNCVKWWGNTEEGSDTYNGGEGIYSDDGGETWTDAGEGPDWEFVVWAIGNSYMNYTLNSNSEGSWLPYAYGRIVENGTYSAVNKNFTEYGTEYTWSINITEATPATLWANKTYSFSTAETDTYIYTIAPYNVTVSPYPLIAVKNYSGTPDNVSLWYRNSTDNVTWGSGWTNSSIYFDNFDSVTPLGDITTVGNYSDGGGDFKWRGADYTPSGNTGFGYSVQKYPYGGSGNSLYTEASSRYAKNYYLDCTGFAVAAGDNISIDFRYHMYGAAMGTLSIQVSNGGAWGTIWSKSGPQHTGYSDAWTRAVAYFDNDDYSGTVQVRLAGLTGASYTSDMGIDHVYINKSNLDQGWQLWDNATNPDLTEPYYWLFDFPNSTGYYEFYSISTTDSVDETVPDTADAICYFDLAAVITKPSIYIRGYTTIRGGRIGS